MVQGKITSRIRASSGYIPRRDNAQSITEGEVCDPMWEHYCEILRDVKLTHVAALRTQGLGLVVHEDVKRGD